MVTCPNRICIALAVLLALVGVSGAGEMPDTMPVETQRGATPVPASPAPADGGIAATEGNSALQPTDSENSVLRPTATDNAPASTGTPPPAGTDDIDETGESGLLTASGEQEEAPPPTIADPIEPVNRGIFYVNDKLYRWVLKPVAKGYKFVVPEEVRISVRNFFFNLATPIRAVNALLQGKIKDTGTELARFGINSTIGMAGLFDAAKDFHLTRKDEDTGQTLGVYGLGNGFYLVLPILGPSSARDTVGLAGDTILDPTAYLLSWEAALGMRFVRAQTDLTFRINEYEELTDAAVDPYSAVKDVYIQYRAKKVRE